MEMWIPFVIIITGTVSSFLITLLKMLFKSLQNNKELADNTARLIVVMVCAIASGIIMQVFEDNASGFIVLFLAVLGSNQLAYFGFSKPLGVETFIERSVGNDSL